MRYMLSLLIGCTIVVSQQSSTHAAATFSITNVTTFAHLPLTRSVTLETVMGTIEERVYLENIELQGSLGTIRTAPADLLTVMAAIDERIILENIENTGVTTIAAAPAALLTVMQSIESRFYVENIEQLLVSTLPQLVLTGGVPTGTVVRAIAPANEPTTTATHTPLLTVTPTVVATVPPLVEVTNTPVIAVTTIPTFWPITENTLQFFH
jgi:hypothetical protein